MWRAALLSLLFTLSATAEPPQFSMGHDHMEKLGAPGCAWPFVQEHLDVCQFQINALAYLSPFDELESLVQILEAKDIAISIECAYFDWTSTMDTFTEPNPKGIHDVPLKELKPGIGRETALLEIKKIAPFTSLGGTPDYIVMDGPIRRLIEPDGGPFGYSAPGLPLDDAIAEMVAYMRAWVETFPEIKFVCITNFPNWAWKDYPAYKPDKKGHGDWHACISKLVAAAKAEKLPLAGIRADNPYEYAIGENPLPWDAKSVDWFARIADLEKFAEDHDLDFQMTINSANGGMASAQGFYRESLKYLAEYRKRGGTPALYIFHTWYAHPMDLGPEDEPYTLTNLVKAGIQDFLGTPGAALARELAKPRPKMSHTVLDIAAPATPDGNAHPDFAGTGEWSYWTATGADSPIALGPGKATLAPMKYCDTEDVPGFGYQGRVAKGFAHIKRDHVERTEMVPNVGQTPVLRWTSKVEGKVRVKGSWWMSAPGNMGLAIYLDGAPILSLPEYTNTWNPGHAFDETLAVKSGDTIEFWADANGDPRHDAVRLRATITVLD